MRVLMISIMRDFRYSNTGIDQLTGYLRAHQKAVDILYFHDRETDVEILSRIEQTVYDMYCFSVYSVNLMQCETLTVAIKQKHPSSFVMWGGSFVTQFHPFFDEGCANVDYFVLGDGERPTLHLINCLAEGRVPTDPAVVKNDGKAKEYKAAMNEAFPVAPVLDYYENDSPERNRLKTHCLQTKSNICTGRCSFCLERRGKVVYKPVEAIANEIYTVCSRFGVRKIFISDDNIFDPTTDIVRRRIEHLCEAIEVFPFPINLTCYATACSLGFTEPDEQLLDRMNRAGFTSMFIGIESGNADDLKLYRKKAKMADNERIVYLLRKHGINPIIGFINFNPYSTKNSLMENLNYLDRIGSANINNYINSFLDIYPGTAIWEKVKADGLLAEGYDYRHTMQYHYKDCFAERIARYIQTNLPIRNSDFEITASQLLLLYYDMLHMVPETQQYEQEVFRVVAEHHAQLDRFFRLLYTAPDIEKISTDELVGFLRRSQPELRAIKEKILYATIPEGIDASAQIKLIKGIYN